LIYSQPHRPDYLPFGKPNFGTEEIGAVTRVLQSGWVGMGPETLAFEQELSSFVGTEYVVAVNSCTSALFLSLHSLGIGPGDEVIVPSLTWCSTANAVLYLGATPVFCDVELNTMSGSPATIVAALTARTKAVIHVHYGGLASDMRALGAIYPDGNPVGSSGNLTCFSFYANKNLSTGDGGAIAVRDPELAEKARLASHQGLQSDAWKRFSHPMATLTPGIAELGYKMNFTDLQACIGRVQLKRQPEFRARRLSVAKRYLDVLSTHTDTLRFQEGLVADSHARHLFVLRVPIGELTITRNELLLELRAYNIGASIHYAPLHTLSLYQPYVRGILPNVEQLMQDILTLPISASMTDEDASYVADQVIDTLVATRRA
jgi:dTDP-4-amino-4,6-dideoxygalactose transaminase